MYLISVLEIPKGDDWRMLQGRCTPIEMRRLSQPDLALVLINCARKFGKRVPDIVIDSIWQRVGGHPRDALTRLGMVLESLPEL